jgi:tRNA(Leu) C34 or U34 (ribose-2'-O)-methylase TrmL
MKEKLATPVGWAMSKVDATKEQKRQVDKVLDEVAPDFYFFQEESKGLTKRILAALDGQTVDPEGMARLQEAGTQLFDRYMKRVVKAALDVSAILTYEQRHRLIEIWRSYEQGDRIF